MNLKWRDRTRARDRALLLEPALPPIPEIPPGATAAQAAAILIQVVGSLAEQFARANRARDRRDRRRLLMLAATAGGLVLDIGLSVLAFFLVGGLAHADHVTAQQQQVITRQAAELARQAAEIHQNQLSNCASTNKTRATVRSTWHSVLDQFDTPAATAATRQFVATQEGKIDQAYKPVNCAQAYSVGS